MLFLAMLAGEWLLFLWRGVPLHAAPIFILIPAWVAGTWMTHLTPGWGVGAVEELRRMELLLVTLFAGITVIFFLRVQAGVSRISCGSAMMSKRATALPQLSCGFDSSA